MAAYDRRSFAGGAASTTLASGIDASTLTVTIASSTGWPTGSAGDFGVVIDRGTASEEKVLAASRSGTTLTLASGGRGIDGTAGVTHATGATVEHCLLARDLDEANAHLSDDALDHHSQYHNDTRGDARYTLQANNLSDVDSASTARTNLGLGTAAITDTGTGATNTILGNDSRLTDARTPTDNSVSTVKLQDDAVTAAKIADGAIDAAAKFAAGVVDSAAIAADAVGSSELADNAVDAGAIATGAVTTAKIADDAVTNAKLAVAYVPGTRSDSVASGSTGDDGTSVSFGVTFAADPNIQLTVENNSNADLIVSIETRSTTGFTYRVAIKDLSDTFGTTHNYVLHWLAIGALA